jgi:hypothetical protein
MLRRLVRSSKTQPLLVGCENLKHEGSLELPAC